MKFSTVAATSAAVLAGSAVATPFALTGANMNPNFLSKREQSLSGAFGFGKNPNATDSEPSSTSGASSSSHVTKAAVALPAVALVAGMLL